MMLKKMFNISDDFRLYYTLSVDQKLFLNRLNDEIDKYEISDLLNIEFPIENK